VILHGIRKIIIPALQAVGIFDDSVSWAFSPGYHMAGLRPFKIVGHVDKGDDNRLSEGGYCSMIAHISRRPVGQENVV
jgi:hypothetical protein